MWQSLNSESLGSEVKGWACRSKGGRVNSQDHGMGLSFHVPKSQQLKKKKNTWCRWTRWQWSRCNCPAAELGTKAPAAINASSIELLWFKHSRGQCPPLNVGIFQRDSFPADPENAPRGPAGWNLASPGLCCLHSPAGKHQKNPLKSLVEIRPSCGLLLGSWKIPSENLCPPAAFSSP